MPPADSSSRPTIPEPCSGIYNLIDQLEKRELIQKRYVAWRELYQWPAGVGAAFLTRRHPPHRSPPEALAMKFGHPLVLAGRTARRPRLVGLLLFLARRRRDRLVRAIRRRPQPRLGRPRPRHRPRIFASTPFSPILAVVALVGLDPRSAPRLPERNEQAELQGLPYILAIDASRSMLAADVRPNRWVATTNAVDRFLASAGNDRVGIISFAGVAYLNAPLSFDMTAIRTTVRYLDPELMNDAGSSLASAVERAGRYFASNNIPQRVVILVSDGEDLDGNLIPTARRWARERAQGLRHRRGHHHRRARFPSTATRPTAAPHATPSARRSSPASTSPTSSASPPPPAGSTTVSAKTARDCAVSARSSSSPSPKPPPAKTSRTTRTGSRFRSAVAIAALLARILLGADRSRRPQTLPAIGAIPHPMNR
jgi:hypothetical protein